MNYDNHLTRTGHKDPRHCDLSDSLLGSIDGVSINFSAIVGNRNAVLKFPEEKSQSIMSSANEERQTVAQRQYKILTAFS